MYYHLAVTFLTTKIEIKMKKANFSKWKTLENTDEGILQGDNNNISSPTSITSKFY